MKILQVAAYAAPYPGNFIKSLLALDRRLEEKGHRTIYAFPHNAREIPWCKELQKTRTVYFLPLAKARILPKTYQMLSGIMKKEGVDIVHSHFELYDIPLAAVLPKQTKMFWHLHDAIENLYSKAGRLHKLLYKLHYKTFSKRALMLSVSEKHAKFCISLGFRAENVHVVLNGTDLSRIKQAGLSPAKKYDFLIFAWDFYRKGADLAIEAAKMLSKEGLRFRIGFVGNDALWEMDEVKAVLDEPWFFKQPFVSDINELYGASKAFLHISRAEGCSYALQEAVYSGLPVVCSDIDENLFIKGVPTVVFAGNGDAGAVSLRMKELIENGFVLDEKAVSQAKQQIEQEYSTGAWAAHIEQKYREYGNLSE